MPRADGGAREEAAPLVLVIINFIISIIITTSVIITIIIIIMPKDLARAVGPVLEGADRQREPERVRSARRGGARTRARRCTSRPRRFRDAGRVRTSSVDSAALTQVLLFAKAGYRMHTSTRAPLQQP